MRIYWSGKVCTVCGVLSLLMLTASYWQWTRYEGKKVFISTMEERIAQPAVPLHTLLSESDHDYSRLYYRKVTVEGEYDFSHEMALRNRRYEGISGVYAITPLKESGVSLLRGKPSYVLVSRGFVPLSKAERESRKEFQKNAAVAFTGIIKESMSKKIFAPSDPATGAGSTWVDQFLRMDIPLMQGQLPYPVLPFYLEIVEKDNFKGVEESLMESRSGRDELFFLPGKESSLSQIQREPDLDYPIPMFNTVIPPGRHFGYIFEWAIMAVLTMLIGLILQLRPPRTGSLSS